MKISDRGQITIPKNFRNRLGLNKNVEVEFVPTEEGLLIQKRTRKKHPVDTVIGILNRPASTDQYLEEVRGR
ncbi:MAG TPA: AbrB/MazE/SpoVT family DNA-binding domain-containing protein [Desulfatirhabdiaceae bacterium]|nr:AbrB/MazE/SpoVT family DNA-binding domain-containing protein [Desulfatirhabdiaceae bacterium]